MRLYSTMLAILAVALCSQAMAADDDRAAAFKRDVLPLLKGKCYKCHSHESGKMKGNLTLDSRTGWRTGGDNGPAIIPGDANKSLLIQAVRRVDEDLAMPPKEPLTLAEVKLLEDWVNTGAIDPRSETTAKAKLPDTDWWSLQPLTQSDPPKVDGTSHPIDAFLSVKRSEAGLSPSPRADQRTQLRRVTYDLHGLPPTPEALAQFQADSSSEAYERLVDTLLDSPRYGERWARHWLDTVHFADSHGCEHDKERPHAWRYRDYVIGRLNADVPWQRFIREQLATDVFYADQAPLTAALGFIGAGPFELSRKTTAPVTFAYLDRDDMVTQTMGAFASTTVNCARCHDHKFDPISREDYYAMQAVFAGVDKGNLLYDADPAIALTRQRWTDLLLAAEKRDEAVLLAEGQRQTTQKWTRKRSNGAGHWQALTPSALVSAGGADLKILDDASILASGKSPAVETYVITAETTLTSMTAIRLELLPHESLPKNGPGRAPNGNLHLNAFTCQLFEPGSKDAMTLEVGSATADWNQGGWTISHVLDANPKTAWGIYPNVGMRHYGIFVLKERATLKAGSRLSVTLKQSHGGEHVIGRFRLSVSESPPERLSVMPDDVSTALQTPEANRSKAQHMTLAAHVARLTANAGVTTVPPKVQIYAVNKKKAVLEVNVLNRGDIEKPVAVAHPGAVAAISGLEGRFKLADPKDEAARRAALADWLASPDNPLTWRSIVNRVWHYHFGGGICDTPNDLGRMGGKPSHPELLDWLAVWFRDEAKGSLKALHRLIVSSEAYRQRSEIREQAAAVDGDNRLLWRMNRMRLDAEQYRDALRQISGRLDLAMGGPGVKHFIQTKGVHETPKLDYKAYDWSRDDAMRRSIYRVVWRGIPDPFMEAMDFPNLGLLAPTRTATISPLQSLVLFNNDFVLFHSKRLADTLQGSKQLTPPAWGSWHQIGPITGGDFNALHATRLPPEKQLDLKGEYGQLRWLPSNLQDGKPMELRGVNSAFYFYRTIDVERSMTVTLSLGSDDSIKVWLNDKSVHEHKIERGIAPDQEELTLKLKAGRNDLLIKIVNGAGPGGIYFKASAAEAIALGLPVTAEQVADAYSLIHQRTPAAEEQSMVVAYAQKHGLAAACRLMFNSSEFLYVE